jgi:hypothetical protein
MALLYMLQLLPGAAGAIAPSELQKGLHLLVVVQQQQHVLLQRTGMSNVACS